LKWTPIGRNVYAIGSNPEAARLAGVPVGRWTWLSLVFCGGLTAFAGVLYSSLSGPSLTFGPSLLLPSFAAVFLGSTQLVPGRFNVWGTMIAIFALATGVQGLQMVLSVQWLNDFFYGFTLLLAVSFAVWRQRAMVDRRLVDLAQHDDASLARSSEEDPEDPSDSPGQNLAVGAVDGGTR
jgi:ribose transport system permease protein